MSLERLEKKLEIAMARLPDIVQKNMVIAANDAVAIIQRRIQTTGRDSKGNLFRDYNPAYKRRKAGLTKKKIRRAEKRLENIIEGSKESKITPKLLDTIIGIRGKYRGHVDYTFTGQMWRNTGIVEKSAGRRVRVLVGGRSPETVEKLKSNADYRGEVLALSKEESLLIKDTFNERMGNDFKQLLSER